MDQAICLGAQDSAACRIDFDPLRLTAVPVPDNWQFVVASSLIDARKSGSAQAAYNQRTRECREALATVVANIDPVVSVDSYRALLAHMPADELHQLGETIVDGVLRRRFRHVVTEALRVDQAQAAMSDSQLAAFGRLMTR
jgi:galactokinase